MSDRLLVDTDVLSAGAPSKAQAISRLIAWRDRNSERLYVSVVTMAKIEDGIAKSKRQGSTRKAARLREWLETLVHLYSPRIPPSTSQQRGSQEPYRIWHEASGTRQGLQIWQSARSPGNTTSRSLHATSSTTSHSGSQHMIPLQSCQQRKFPKPRPDCGPFHRLRGA
jgi:predicted nucleic acid-binding protein